MLLSCLMNVQEKSDPGGVAEISPRSQTGGWGEKRKRPRRGRVDCVARARCMGNGNVRDPSGVGLGGENRIPGCKHPGLRYTTPAGVWFHDSKPVLPGPRPMGDERACAQGLLVHLDLRSKIACDGLKLSSGSQGVALGFHKKAIQKMNL